LQDLGAAVLSFWTSFDSRHCFLLVSFLSSGRVRSGSTWRAPVKLSRPSARALDRELFVRNHPSDGLRIRGRDLDFAGQSRLTAGRLLGQDVRMEGVIPLQLTAS